MDWQDIPRNPARSVLAQFGVTAAAILTVLAVWRADAATSKAVLAGAAVVIATIALLRPMTLRVPYIALSIATFPIAWLVSRLFLAIMFYGVVTPIGLAFRAFRRDVLRRSQPPGESYFVDRKQPDDLRSYLRQF